MGEEVRSFHIDEIVDGSFAMIRLMVEILHAVLRHGEAHRIQFRIFTRAQLVTVGFLKHQKQFAITAVPPENYIT